jgi:hypothetical protein
MRYIYILCRYTYTLNTTYNYTYIYMYWLLTYYWHISVGPLGAGPPCDFAPGISYVEDLRTSLCSSWTARHNLPRPVVDRNWRKAAEGFQVLAWVSQMNNDDELTLVDHSFWSHRWTYHEHSMETTVINSFWSKCSWISFGLLLR